MVPSDPSFCDYISPITNPTMFEDPRTLTEARAIALSQRMPAYLGSQTFQLYALQLRAALTDRLSVIATKDGFIVSHNALQTDGWADIMIGLKYNLITNYCTHRLLSVGATYELPIGSPRVLQGTPRILDGESIDGQYNVFLTGGTPIGYNGHWISAFGVRIPANHVVQSGMWYWSNHFDVKAGMTDFYGLLEINWYHWYDSGNNAVTAGLNGGDLVNLGSTNITNTDIATGALGLKYKPHGNLEIGAAYEVPLTNRRGIMGDRITLDLILRY